MRFSIVIPVYNVADYLQGCIDSVLANDCTDCEIILVDDGATDGRCPAICDENAARHPELIRVIHQENQGQGGARNTGLEAAKGEYVFFVDSDDTIMPQSLQVLRHAIQKTHADIYSFQQRAEKTDGDLRSLQRPIPPGRASAVFALTACGLGQNLSAGSVPQQRDPLSQQSVV